MDTSDANKLTRASLLIRVRSGEDQSAWSEFVEIYGPVIFGYCRLRKLQDSDGADVTQNVLLRLSKSMANFEYRPELGRFRDWLGKVVYRELLRHWHREKKQEQAQMVDYEAQTLSADSDWGDYFQTEVLRASFEKIRSEFEPETIEIFQHAWFQDESAAEVASQLGVSIDRVYVAKSRVLKRLREEVVRLTEDLPVAGL
jgi:RNA polymerase sigma-70 factor, ECF subfamily